MLGLYRALPFALALWAVAVPAFGQSTPAARKMGPADITGALTYTPVQQGTGIGQGNNTIKLGWSGTTLTLKATVDATDLGGLAMQSWVLAQFQNAIAANVSGTVLVANGGTGATTPAAALTALGGYAATNPAGYQTAAQVAGSTVANVSGTVALANGGTGATNPADALTALGAYPAANPAGYQTASQVAAATATAGNVSGVVGLANGGTGATTASSALTALGAYPAANPAGYQTAAQASAGFLHADSRVSLFPGAADSYTSPDSMMLGGQAANAGASITVRGQPYGYYDTGTLLSLVDTSQPFTSSRAGVNGGFETGVPAMAGYGSFDSVNFYNGLGATPARLSVSGVTYDATHIYPPSGQTFSPAQLALLRPSMWVMTNSVDPSVSTTPAVPNTLAPLNAYGSTVLSWGPSAILVSGWTVPGSGHAAAGQVPTSASPQTVVFGSATKQFARNTVMTHNPGVSGSSTRAYEAEEVDMNDYGTSDFQTAWHGYTVHYTPSGIVPAANSVAAHNVQPSADSWGVDISGPLPRLLHLRGGPLSTLIDADSLQYLQGGSPLPAVGSQSLLSDQAMYVDTNRAHLLTFSSRDAASAGPGSSSIHLGLRYDSTFGALDGSGTKMAEIVWNPQGYYGGLQICTASGACGLKMANSGTVTLANGMTVSNGGADITGAVTMRNGVSIVGGLTADALTLPATVSGTLALANGGTGAISASAARTNLGLATVASSGSYADLVSKPTLGGAAALNVGAVTGTVAAGDDSRITGALSASSAASTYQAKLGFTPVQQGTGSGQLANVIKIGWSGTKTKLQVDGTDQGNIAMETWVSSVYQPTATLAAAVSTALSGPTSPCILAASGNVSVQSNLCIEMTDGSTGTTASYVSNLNLTATSAGGTGDKVGLYSRTVSASGSAGVWSMNTVMDVLPRTGGAARSGSIAGYELDIDNTDCDAGLNPAGNATCPTWGKGLWVTGLTGGGLYAIRDAILVTAAGNGTLAHYGLNFLGPYIDYNTIYDGTNSTYSIVLAGTHTDGIDFTRGAFTEAAIKFNGGHKLCWTADCLYETHFDGTAGALDLNANGALIQFSPTGMVTSQSVGGGTLLVYGTNGNGYIGNGNGAIGWNLSAGQGEIDFTNNYTTSALPGAFSWYKKQSNGTQTLLATLSSSGVLGATKMAPGSIEMGLVGAANTPDVKFHSGATASTYDGRISVAGGNGSTATGSMGFEASAFIFAGSVSMPNVLTCANEARSKYLCLNGNVLQVNP